MNRIANPIEVSPHVTTRYSPTNSLPKKQILRQTQGFNYFETI